MAKKTKPRKIISIDRKMYASTKNITIDDKLIDGKFPTLIELFSKKYTIEYFDDLSLIDDRNKDCLGYVDFISCTIKIFYKKGFTDYIGVWQTLFHEVLHIIKRELNIELKEGNEENIVDTFALGIIHFLINNNINIGN